MKNNSKKTNKQNTARSAQNTTRRMSRRTKDERRNILFSKKHVKMETRRAVYGTDHGVAYALARGTDLNRRFVAAFLALVFAISTMVVGFSFAGRAEEKSAFKLAAKGADSNLVVDKRIFPTKDANGEYNGTYTLQMSAYAKGAIKSTSKQIPTDYVLVVDQSGSMNMEDMPTGTEYNELTTPASGWTFNDFQKNELDEDGNTVDKEYYIKDGDKYYRVYRKWGDLFEYQPRNSIYAKDIVDKRNLHWFADTAGTESSFNSQYYYQPAEDQNVDLQPRSQYLCGQPIQEGGANDHNFYPITISSQGRTLYYSIRFSYQDSTGEKHYLRYLNNTTNSTANKNKDTGNCIWYRDPDGNYFGPGDSFWLVINISYNFANNFVLGWIDGNTNYDTFYTYGQITERFQSGMYIQNPLFIRHVGYNSLAYRDSDGEEHIIAHTDYCDANDNPTNDKQGITPFGATTNIETNEPLVLYEAADSAKQTRLEAVQGALNNFVQAIANQVDRDGDTVTPVDHRVAIVGFSSSGYNNNELLTNNYNDFQVDHNASWTNYNGSSHFSLDGNAHDGIQKSTADSQTDYYKDALLNVRQNPDANNQYQQDSNGNYTVNPALPDGIRGLTAHGGTEPQTGLDMAYQILNRNDKKDEYAAGTRKAVVIFFTDGRPGNNATVNQYDAANTVVSSANRIKTGISDSRIYSVGIFGETDSNPLTYQEGYAGPYYYYDDLQDLYNSLYCGSRGNRSHTNDSNEKVSSNKDISDVSLSSVNYQVVNYWPNQIEETYYPDYAKTTSAFYGNTTASWSWSTGGVMGIGATSHSASGQIPTYRLSFFWRDCLRNTANYPKTENDTIYDYMNVVSSAYPRATSFDNGWSKLSRENKQSRNYNSTIASVRDAKSNEGRFYYSATDMKNLSDIFVDIVSDATTSTIDANADLYLQDIVSENFDLPKNPSNHVSAVTYIGGQYTDNGSITFNDDSEDDIIDEITDDNIRWDGKKLTVRGFNYSENYIMHGKEPNDNQHTGSDEGKKLVVTITGLKPASSIPGPNNSTADNTGDAIKSNVDTATSDEGLSGIMQTNDDESITCLEKFESPTISRHKYTLTVGEANTAATVGASFKLVGEDGSTTLTTSDLEDAFVEEDGERSKLDSAVISWSGASTKTMYLENLPTGAKIVNSMSIDNDSSGAYIYSIASETGGVAVPSANLAGDEFTVDYADTTYRVTSVAQNRDVTVHLKADDSPYVDSSYKFKVNITLTGTGIAQKLSTVNSDNNGVIQFTANGEDTLVGVLELTRGTVDPIELAATIKVPDGATLAVGHTDPFYNTETPFKYTDERVSTKADYSAHAINTATHIYIVDTVNNDVGAGVAEDNNSSRIILYVLGGLAAVSTGAGAAYVYRKKDEFVEK